MAAPPIDASGDMGGATSAPGQSGGAMGNDLGNPVEEEVRSDASWKLNTTKGEIMTAWGWTVGISILFCLFIGACFGAGYIFETVKAGGET